MSQQSEKKKPVTFSEAQLALIDQGLAEFERGEGMTPEEAHELARKGTQAWLKIRM
jgi:predicted transcriptional regulator